MRLNRSAPQRTSIDADAFNVRRRISLECAAALLLVVCLTAPPILANASPPDPVWISGIYDDADSDNVVALLTNSTAVAAPRAALVERQRPRLRRVRTRSVPAF